MMAMSRRKSRWTIILVALAFVPLASCAESDWNAQLRTGTMITPDYFRFAEIVPADEHGGGWRAVCIKAQIGQRIASPAGERASINTRAVCNIEFGTPLENRDQGKISLDHAQRVWADVANHSAYKVLQHTQGVTSEVCRRVIDVMNIYITGRISGARAAHCGTTRWRKAVPEVWWP